MALVPGVRAASATKPARPAGCDDTRRGASYGAGGAHPKPASVAPCVTTTFPDFGESAIVVSPPIPLANRTTAPSAVMHSDTYGQHPNFPTSPTAGLARTVDAGAHWQ